MKPDLRAVGIWGGLALALSVPLMIAAQSPLIAWREPVYIVAGFAGIAGLVLMVVQPLLAAGLLPGLRARPGRRIHRWTGIALLVLVAVHVGGLWITSPPDVIDALTFTSPTSFSIWGVLAMWALIFAAPLALMRRRLRPMVWRLGHSVLVAGAVAGTVAHALLITGTMGWVSKIALCGLAIAVCARSLWSLRAWAPLARRRS